LVFPNEFTGRGDMSRGGLLLRCVAEGRELDYVPLLTAPRHGPRPARLVPQRGILARVAHAVGGDADRAWRAGAARLPPPVPLAEGGLDQPMLAAQQGDAGQEQRDAWQDRDDEPR
jgi:hypothetical protein